jgi:hypothetical protein
MLDKSRVDKELARRLCAAFISYQMGVSITTLQENAGRGG